MDRYRVAVGYGIVALAGLAFTTAMWDHGSHVVDGPGPLAFDPYLAGIFGFGWAGLWAVAMAVSAATEWPATDRAG